tara:strand:+ start:164 stop:667 length:504 start_codon:yes stop_codon:yes gene_type:complete
MNEQKIETDTLKLRRLISHIFMLPNLMALIHRGGISLEKENEIVNKSIPEAVAICLKEENTIMELSKIDARLEPLIRECYSFIDLLSQKEDRMGHLAGSLEEHVFPQIREILEICETKEQLQKVSELLNLYRKYFSQKTDPSYDYEEEMVTEEKIKEAEKVFYLTRK